MMNDLRLELRFRNNALWHAIFDLYPSVAAFCRAHGFSMETIGRFLNLTVSPYAAGGRHYAPKSTLRPTARRVCDVTGIGPDELFPPHLYTGVIPSRRVAEVSAAMLPLSAARHVALPATAETDLDVDALGESVRAVLHTLTPREQKVIEAHFGFNGAAESLDDIAKSFSVTKERIRQIEAKALRKLRHPSRSRRLSPFLDHPAPADPPAPDPPSAPAPDHASLNHDADDQKRPRVPRRAPETNEPRTQARTRATCTHA